MSPIDQTRSPKKKEEKKEKGESTGRPRLPYSAKVSARIGVGTNLALVGKGGKT